MRRQVEIEVETKTENGIIQIAKRNYKKKSDTGLKQKINRGENKKICNLYI